MSPLQVTEIEYNPSGLSRFLLSDKQHKMWSVVKNDALLTFQTQFPEFADSSVHRLCGGIILPTRFHLNFHPNLGEFLLQIQQFEYKGGAGNNEFANPIFHGSDVELQSFITRFRQIDVSHLLDRDQHAAQSNNSTAAPHPFIASVKATINSIQSDAQNAQMEVEAEVPADHAAALDAIDDGFKPKVTAASNTIIGKDNISTSASQLGGIGYSQLDGSGSQNYFFSQEFDAELEDTRHDFSQRDEHKRNSNAHIATTTATPAATASSTAVPAAATTAPPAGPPAFSATHLFLSNHARTERALQAGGQSATPPMNKNQAFVAAFGGVAVSTSFAVKPPFASTSNSEPAGSASAKPEIATSNNTSESSNPSITADKSTSLSFDVSPPAAAVPSPSASPARRQLRSSKGESKTSSPNPSPTRSSQRLSQPPPLSPAVHRSQAPSASASLSPSKNQSSSLSLAPPQEPSMHNLMPSSLDDVVNHTSQRSQHTAEEKTADHSSDSDSDAADRHVEQENEFPFLTQAAGGSLDEQEDDEQEQPQTQEPEPKRPSTRARATPPRASPKKSEDFSKPTPSTSVSYDASSIQARQAERKRKLQEEIAAEAEAKRKVEEQVRKKKEEEAAAAAAAEAQRQEEIRKQQAIIDAEKKAQAEAIESARQQQAAAAATAATHQHQVHHSFIQPLTQSAEAMSDDEVCLLTERLTEGSPHKRPRTEEQKSQRPALNYTQASSAAVLQSKKPGPNSRLSGPRSVAVPAAVEESVRRALEAVEAAQSSSYATVATTRDTRAKRREGHHYPPPSLSLVPSNDETSSKTKTTNVDKSKPSAEEKSNTSVHAHPVVPPSAVSAPAASTTSLPPFGSPFAISSRQVQAALRFFRAKKQRRTQQVNDENSGAQEEGNSDNENDEDEEMEPGEVQYSQWY